METSHDRTAATEMLRRGATIVEVSQVLRHRDLAPPAIHVEGDLCRSSGNGVQVTVADIRLFRKWSAGEGVTVPGAGVVSLR
jgi:hypothetical protein